MDLEYRASQMFMVLDLKLLYGLHFICGKGGAEGGGDKFEGCGVRGKEEDSEVWGWMEGGSWWAGRIATRSGVGS